MTTATTTATAAKATGSQDLSQSTGRLDAQAAGAYVGELFEEHRRMVLGLCRLLLRDPVEAEDAAQQVFLSAHEALRRGSVPRDPAAWLAAITRNECRARARARMREPLALIELPSDLPDPLAAAIRAADLRAIWSALGALPRRQRRALVLRELGGLSYHELGRALGVSHSAVESLLFRARQQLRAFLAATNAVVAPVAVREQLAQLIPRFDPGTAGVVGRLAALPVAWKLASAAVGVGIVASGAGGSHPRPEPVRHVHRHVGTTVARRPAAAVGVRHVVSPQPVVHRRRHDRETRDGEREHVATRPAESASEGPGPAPEPVQVETSHEGPGEAPQVQQTTTTTDSHSGSDGSGHDGSSDSYDGSSHSGPG